MKVKNLFFLKNNSLKKIIKSSMECRVHSVEETNLITKLINWSSGMLNEFKLCLSIWNKRSKLVISA